MNIVKCRSMALWVPIATMLATTAWAGQLFWDISHGPFGNFDPNGEYNQIVQQLEQNDFTLIESDESVIENGLWDADILVISVLSNYDTPYTAAEVERIINFVNAGGGLIVLGDNSAANPNNILPVLEPFHMLAARGDDLEDPMNFIDHELFQGVATIGFRNGGAVEGDEENGAIVMATDNNDLGGIVINETFRGKVLLFGDADFWANQLYNAFDNSALALNSFNLLDRDREGRIGIEEPTNRFFLPNGISVEQSFHIFNNGTDVLEVGFDLQSEGDWISVDSSYMILEALSESFVTINLNTEILPEDTTVTASLIINHNDPTNESFSIDFSIYVYPSEPTHFQVPGPTGHDHSLLIRELTIDGAPADPGIEIGVFTPDGICAGGAVFNGEMMGIAARADDPLTVQIDGFRAMESFSFRLFEPWSDIEKGASPVFETGPDRFTQDALTILTLDGRNDAVQWLRLSQRWNLVSLNVAPQELEPASVLSSLIERNLLVMMKDDHGLFWDLRTGFSNLHDWDIAKGYQIMVNQPASFEVNGLEIPVDTPIVIGFGWSIIPYYPRNPQPVAEALATIHDDVRLLKRDDGAFYYPLWNWDGISALEPSEGYKIALTAPGTLVYSDQVELVDRIVTNQSQFAPSQTGIDMSLLLMGFAPDTKIRIISPESTIAGEGKIGIDGRAGIPVWGDNPASTRKEGLSESEEFTVQLSNGGRWVNADITWLQGEPVFKTDAITVGRLKETANLPDNLDLTCYPNPFNDRFTVSFSASAGDIIELTVYDINGRILDRQSLISTASQTKGSFTCISQDLPSGVLLVKLTCGNDSRTVKAVHLP